MPDTTRRLTARHAGTCPACTKPIEPGDQIARIENNQSRYRSPWKHAACQVAWLVDGRTIPGSGGVALRIGINALGERVGDNSESVLGGIAAYAPDGVARANARAGMVANVRASWQQGDDGWVVKVTGNLHACGGLTGREVAVESRSGDTKTVTLGERLHCWNAGRAATYEVAR